MLNSLALHLSTRPRQRHLFFLAAALASILLFGYYFGTFDQFAHIPFLKFYADPGLFPNDPYIHAMSRQNYSYFWRLLAPIYQLDRLYFADVPTGLQPLLLGSTMLILHVAATYLTFWALWALSLELFHNAVTALLTVLAFVVPHIGFGGFPVLEFSLLNRTFTLPFLLWAILFYLRRRYGLAFAIAGIMYNIHIISVNFVVAMLLLDAGLRWRAVGWRNIAAGIVLFTACAAPVLIWRLTDPPIAMRPDPEWFALVALGSLYNLFVLISPYTHILFVTLSGLSTLAMYFIGRRRAPAPAHDRTVFHFILAVMAILLVEVLASSFAPVTIIIQLQIIRAGLFATVFGYLYFVHALVIRRQAGELRPGDFNWLMGMTLAWPLPMMNVIGWAVHRWLTAPRARPVVFAAVNAAFLLIAVPMILSLNLWAPGLYPFGPQNAWREAQFWARDHTARDAVFITPPEKWWLYDSDWRVFSERSTVVTHGELLMVALVPSYTPEWRERFSQLAPGAIEKFAGNFFDNLTFTREAFYTLNAADFERIARRYGASYLVLEKPNARHFPVVYENEQFVIYDLR